LKYGAASGLVIAGQKNALSRHAGSRPNLLRSFCAGRPPEMKNPVRPIPLGLPDEKPKPPTKKALVLLRNTSGPLSFLSPESDK
jgi:hypothetical protein